VSEKFVEECLKAVIPCRRAKGHSGNCQYNESIFTKAELDRELDAAVQAARLAGAEAMREAAIEARPDGKPYPDSDTNEQRAFVSGWNTAIRNWYEAIRSIPAPKEGDSE
jgi:uncharacterized iron-regulated protein